MPSSITSQRSAMLATCEMLPKLLGFPQYKEEEEEVNESRIGFTDVKLVFVRSLKLPSLFKISKHETIHYTIRHFDSRMFTFPS